MNATAPETNWTLLDLLNWTTAHFKQAGIEDARLNAELLLSEATGMERIMLYARFEEQADEEVRARYREMVKKRAQRCPVQYVIGHTDFLERRFYLNPSVLVPRPETELLVRKCMGLIDRDCERFLFADIGTGSGVIGVSLACEFVNTVCYATDMSEEALDLARLNARSHDVADRVVFSAGSLLDALPDGVSGGKRALDLIASNPPYIPTNDISGLQPEVGQWEPPLALDGGDDGLVLVRQLIANAHSALKPGGWLVLELGDGQSERVRDMVEACSGWCAESLGFIRDERGCARVLHVRAN